MNGQVDLGKYYRHVCPWCRSANWVKVTLLIGWHKRTERYTAEPGGYYYHCLNCERVTTAHNPRPDRKAMRRDYNKLGKALAGKNKP